MTETDGSNSTLTNSNIVTKSLYVDDLRELPSSYSSTGWDVARSFHEAITKLEQYDYQVLSLDHDLASFYGSKEMTGYDIALWLADRKMNGKYVPQQIFVHSANPVGVKNIQAVIDRYLS